MSVDLTDGSVTKKMMDSSAHTMGELDFARRKRHVQARKAISQPRPGGPAESQLQMCISDRVKIVRSSSSVLPAMS